MRSTTYTVTTPYGTVDVTFVDINRAYVHTNHAHRLTVGKFKYTLHYYGNRELDWHGKENAYNSASKEGVPYNQSSPAPTILAKLFAAARDAIRTALAENPRALLTAELEDADMAYASASRELDAAREAYHAAIEVNNAASQRAANAAQALYEAENPDA